MTVSEIQLNFPTLVCHTSISAENSWVCFNDFGSLRILTNFRTSLSYLNYITSFKNINRVVPSVYLSQDFIYNIYVMNDGGEFMKYFILLVLLFSCFLVML